MVCFEAEQVLLHGPNATDERDQMVARFLYGKAKAPQEVYANLKGWLRPSVVVGQPPPYTFTYMPLAFSAVRVIDGNHTAQWQDGTFSQRWRRAHTVRSAPTFSRQRALAFFSTWMWSYGEVWVRALPFVREIAAREHLERLVPALIPDALRSWYAPFARSVEPMAFWPSNSSWASNSLAQRLYALRATEAELAEYDANARHMFETRDPKRCFDKALVCDLFSDFAPLPEAHLATRPWETMQAVLRHHGLHRHHASRCRLLACASNTNETDICPLQVVFHQPPRCETRAQPHAAITLRGCHSRPEMLLSCGHVQPVCSGGI